MKAISKHVSQMKMFDYYKIGGLNSYRSITAGRGADYCEAFIKTSKEEYIRMARTMGILK